MENNQQQILSEIKTLMASVRNQLEELDAKIALWQQLADPQEADIPIDLDFDLDVALQEVPVVVEQDAEPVAEVAVEQDAEQVAEVAVEQDAEQVAEVAVEQDAEPVAEYVEEPVIESAPAEDANADDDLPFFDAPEEIFQPEPAVCPVQKTVEKPAVIDVMTEKQTWRTAMPGSPVKDVRSAIALMDRVLFINTLFGADAMAFQEALNQINQMQSLDEAVEYLAAIHPEWDFNSQTVYSFMMAVRRKVN